MALIADCNTAVTEDAAGWITLDTVNGPMQKKSAVNDVAGSAGEGTFMHSVYAIATLNVDVASTSLIVQTTDGLDEATGQSVTTKYQRVSAIELGHVVGTDWSEWTKVS